MENTEIENFFRGDTRNHPCRPGAISPSVELLSKQSENTSVRFVENMKGKAFLLGLPETLL